jgi:hypothetical protein
MIAVTTPTGRTARSSRSPMRCRARRFRTIISPAFLFARSISPEQRRDAFSCASDQGPGCRRSGDEGGGLAMRYAWTDR